MPEESELVMSTVTKIQYNAIFVNLDEYDKTGMIHISEISPGRIRNIRDFVREGKKIVCVVLRVNQERGYIDLSLRRVGEGQRRKKVNALKQEATAEKIVEFLAKEMKKDPKQVYDKITDAVFEKYDMLYPCFEKIVAKEEDLLRLGLEQKLAERLTALILQRIKPPIVSITGKIIIQSYAPNGVEIIKEALEKGETAGGEELDIKYLGAGGYEVSLKAKDYKTAESNLKECLDTVEKIMKDNNGTFAFARTEKKN